MGPELWITGVGAVGAFGAGVPALERALAAGRPLACPVTLHPVAHRSQGARLVARCDTGPLAELVPQKLSRRMSPVSRFAVAATRLALGDAGLPGLALPPELQGRTAVACATAFGSSSFTERLLVEILEQGPELVSPFLFTDCVANAPAGQIAIVIGAKGANATFTQREAGAIMALQWAARELRRGRVDRVLVGAVEEMPPLVHACLDRFGALARAGADGVEAPRPFDQKRNGYLAGEGAQALLVETAVSAAAAGRPPLARLVAAGSAFDPSATAYGFGTAPGIFAEAVRSTLGNLGLAVEQVDLVVSGASGSRQGDAAEASFLRLLFGPTLPLVVTPKAVIGEHAGGILVPALLALRGVAMARPEAVTTPDPALMIPLHHGLPERLPTLVLATTLAVGGSFSFALLEASR